MYLIYAFIQTPKGHFKMLSTQVRETVKATAPVLEQHGVDLTTHFYARMFEHNPELREIFNQGHQRSGSQQHALAMAVAAYARHIDDPSVLGPVLERIAHKHVSLGIRPEHYGIVGRHLLASICEVLGIAETDAIIDAWRQAYGQLADTLIAIENQMYLEASAQPGGWTGWRTFKVVNKQPESDEITSFILEPADGGLVPMFRPGQYVSVRTVIPGLGYRQPRQYSLSDAPGKRHLRISVKREDAIADQPDGMVSTHLHGAIEAGDLLEVSPPAGEFFLHEEHDNPVVLISAGVGLTPMISMLEHLHARQSDRSIRFYHAARHSGVQSFAPRIRELVSSLSDAASWIVHEQVDAGSANALHDAQGRLDLSTLELPAGADYYICGPLGFMNEQIRMLRTQGVADEHIHYEAFGTGGVQA